MNFPKISKKYCSNNKIGIVIGYLVIIGIIIRIICCFWGYPYQLHTDEPTIVKNAVDMLSRHSWEAFVYNRPDQFEIKCDAFIFQIFSYLKYNVSAVEAFTKNTANFYVLARLYTAFWGTALIVVGALLAKRMFQFDRVNVKLIQIIVAFVFAFSYLFIEHSSYATPDIPLTFFCIIIQYWSIKYLENSKEKDIYIISLFTGIACTIKYPAAIITVYIALIITYKCIQRKRYFEIVKIGLKSLLIILATMFVIAPNLFTNVDAVIKTIQLEARNVHLGADNLGFCGNLEFYFSIISTSLGIFGFLGFVAGIYNVAVTRRIEHFPVILNLLFWFSLSKLPLHWLRWGFPMYVGYILLSASGIGWLCELIRIKIFRGLGKKFIQYVFFSFGIISFISIILSAVVTVAVSCKKDVRIAALDYCTKNGISTKNCIYDGYTAFSFRGGKHIDKLFLFTNDSSKVKIDAKFKNSKYFIMGSNYKNRYYREPNRYANIIGLYEAVKQKYKLIAKFKAGRQFDGGHIHHNINEIVNIKSHLKYLLSNEKLSGGQNWIYKLK